MLNLCMLSGSFEYDSEASLNIFKTFVQKHYPIRANLVVYTSEEDDPDLAPLDDADVLLVFTRRLNTTGASLKRFQTYCEQGKPLVGIRTASHAYQNWLEFDKNCIRRRLPRTLRKRASCTIRNGNPRTSYSERHSEI